MTKRKPWSFRTHMEMTGLKHWVTAQGEIVLIANMKPGHLVATVNFLRRRAPAAKMVELLMMLRGVRPSGDQASLGFQDALEEMANESLDDFLLRACPPFRAMLDRYDACKKIVDDEARQRESELLGDPDPWGNS